MAKVFRSIAILLVPILLYFSVFIAYEPNNYFNLHKSATGTNIMAALRAYEISPQNAIILGDSRTVKLNLQLAQQLTGQPYTNLSYGGASFKEQLDLVDWAIRLNPNLDEIVFALSFYTLNNAYSQDRNIILALNNPAVYMTNLGYNLNMLTNLTDHLLNRPIGSSQESMHPSEYTYTNYTNPLTEQTIPLRETLANHLADLTPRSANWSLNTVQFKRLLKTIAGCAEKNIRFSVVMPPAHEAVISQIVIPYGIAPPMAKALATLRKTSAVVLDYELENRPPLTDDQFYDGFHLDELRGTDAFCKILFSDLQTAHGA